MASSSGSSALDEPWRALCRRERRYVPRVAIDTGGSHRITVVFPRFCKAMSWQHEEPLRAIFGEKDFARWFRVQPLVSLNLEAASDRQLEKLVELFAENAGEALVVERRIYARDEYHESRVLDDRTARLAAKAESEGLAVRWSPAIQIFEKEASHAARTPG